MMKRTQRSAARAASMRKRKEGAEMLPFPTNERNKKPTISLIGPRSKAADRSNERNAKSTTYTFKNTSIGNSSKRVIVDASDFDQEEATPSQLSQISEQARKAIALEHQINDLEAAKASLALELDKILSITLPSMLDSAGMTAFDLEDGSSIEIKEVITGNLPSAQTKPKERERAIAWLMKNGGNGIIKTSFATEFGVDEQKKVAAFEKLIIKQGFAAKKATGVHHQTLCAFVRELLENGKKVPIDTLGIWVGRKAKIALSEKETAKADAQRVKPQRRRPNDHTI